MAFGALGGAMKAMGGAGQKMMNAPGMGAIRKPLAKGMQTTPGLKGIGKGIGLGPSKVRPPSTVGEPLGPINQMQQPAQPRLGGAAGMFQQFQQQRPPQPPTPQPGFMGNEQLQSVMGPGTPVENDQQMQIEKMKQLQAQMSQGQGGMARPHVFGGGMGRAVGGMFGGGGQGQGMPWQQMMQRRGGIGPSFGGNQMMGGMDYMNPQPRQPQIMQQQEPEMY